MLPQRIETKAQADCWSLHNAKFIAQIIYKIKTIKPFDLDSKNTGKTNTKLNLC